MSNIKPLVKYEDASYFVIPRYYIHTTREYTVSSGTNKVIVPDEPYVPFSVPLEIFSSRFKEPGQYTHNYKVLDFKVDKFEDFKNYLPREQYKFVSSIVHEEIFRDGDKITMSVSTSVYTSSFNMAGFTKYLKRETLTINLVTGSIYNINSIQNPKYSKKVRRNKFGTLNDFLGGVRSELIEKFIYFFKLENSLIETESYPQQPPKEVLLKLLLAWFIKFHSIKVPDVYINNMINNYPGLKELRKKKYKMNLTSAIMDKFQLNGSKIKQLMNLYDYLDLYRVHLFLIFFGIDHFNKIPKEIIKYKCYGQQNSWRTTHEEKLKGNQLLIKNYKITNSEKDKFINILITSLTPDITIFLDHLRMRKQIFDKSGKYIKFTFRNIEEFNSEHDEFTIILEEINRKWDISITNYSKELLEQIQFKTLLPVVDKLFEYEVKLLKSDIEYIEEGRYQSHCVSSYIERNSHIVSIRREDGTRCTIEYTSAGVLVQQRMRFNHNPDETWQKVIKEVSGRIALAAHSKLLKPKELLKTERNINQFFKKVQLEPKLQIA